MKRALGVLRSVLRLAGGLFLGGLVLLALIYCASLLFRPKQASGGPDHFLLREEMQTVRAAALDSSRPVVVWQDVDYRLGPSAEWYPRGQSPVLGELVSEGLLPPVEARVGPEPLVLRGVDGIGQYGGSWHRIANSPGDTSVIMWRLSGASLVRFSPMGDPIVPHIARDWEVSEDLREWTFFLREGMRWSDGHPFTADDVVYFFNHEMRGFDGSGPSVLATRGVPAGIEKKSTTSFTIRFAHPYGAFLSHLATIYEFYSPRHYLEKYHPVLGDQKLIGEELKRRNLMSPTSLYWQLKSYFNPQHPRIWPWISRTYRASPPHVFVRNPWYWAVDPEGNQLPYLDEIVFEEVQPQLVAAGLASGRASMQNRHVRFSDTTLLMSERKRGGYEIFHWFPGTRSVWMIQPNLNHRVEPGDPVSTQKADLLNRKEFRQALSLAIDREAIIQAVYGGVGEPSQASPGKDSPHAHPSSARAFVDHKPAEANKLLDTLGLTRRDREGFRTFPDGSRMTWFLNYTDLTGEGPARFVQEDWAGVGVRVIPRYRSRGLFTVEWLSFEHDFAVWTGEGEFNPVLQPRSFVPTNISAMYAPAFGEWFNRGGYFGLRTESGLAMEPSPNHPLRRAMSAYLEALGEADPDKQVAAFRPALELAAQNVWTIGLSTPPPELALVDTRMRNVPRSALVSAAAMTPANLGMETFFFDPPQQQSSPRLKREMVTIGEPPEGSAAAPDGGPSFLWVFVLACLGFLGIRFPFIGRRLLVLVPTFLLVSVISFVVIQAPPGDFLEMRIAQLQLQGDATAHEQVKELREMFHFDKPLWERYLRWMGFYWFLDSSDTGFLQGNLGRSMETGAAANQLIGDRILLTVLISLGSIVFIWILALPIGIYSAVRRYSVGDTLLTFLGFLGMSIPGFLLALILIFLAKEWLGVDAIGLFSPEFATQAHWDWPKVSDLLRHIWLPVVVLGIGGTAAMVRVVRGNLLDELNKPSVTTARSKGLGPVRLLVKYPLRMALNPFVSGLGGIFPQLVSGGALVAIVLSLPTVGPLLLNSLLTQDTYLAASLLLVLSLLAMLGTLVSDLLLLWLDPRIRMEKRP